MHQIADAISSGALREGDRLPPERKLAELMQVGRPTIREALKALANAGVIELTGTRRGAGAVVISDTLPVTLVENREELRLDQIGDLLVARRMLEPMIAQLAAARRTETNLARLRALIDQQTTADRSRFLDLDLRFHQELARCTANETVAALAKVTGRRLERAYDLALRLPEESTAATAIDDHTRIVDAIERRDPERASHAMFRHLRILEDLWAEESGYSVVPRLPSFLIDAADPLPVGARPRYDER